jgi:hypothetical protein
MAANVFKMTKTFSTAGQLGACEWNKTQNGEKK